MLQNPCKTLGFKKNMVYKIPPGEGGKPYPASGLYSRPNNKSDSSMSNKVQDTHLCFSLSHWYSGSGVVLDCIDS